MTPDGPASASVGIAPASLYGFWTFGVPAEPGRDSAGMAESDSRSLAGMPGLELVFSKGEVNRAGNLLAGREGALEDAEDIAHWRHAQDVAQHFRACHSYPLDKVAMGVRQMVATETGGDPRSIGQRLKRFPQMVHKLRRHPKMALARMQDIGGCRALLSDHDELRRVARRLRRQWRIPDNRVSDYITEPQPVTGYRSVHLITERDGRQIEVQLRTEGQQAWAMSIEQVAGTTGWPLKDGEGPDDVLRYFRTAAALIAAQEEGRDPDPADVEELRHLAESTVSLIRSTNRERHP